MRVAHAWTVRAAMMALLGAALACAAQVGSAPESSPQTNPDAVSTTRPLPDIPTLMRQVEANQRAAEAVEKTYIYHSVETQRELDSKGHDKKVSVVEADHFWTNGVQVRRVVRKDGKDLSAEELAKEDQRIDKEVKEAHERREKNDAAGKETDSRGNEEVTVSRLLELGAFTNPRRVTVNGRDTIAVDFTGDPHAKTRNRTEDVIRDLAGTAWIDEQDHVLVRVDGHFTRAFKVGAGLIADIKPDTQFTFQQARINGEVWLPAHIDAQGAARAMLFFSFSGKIDVAYSDYRKFRTSATILPGVTPVPDAPPAKDVQ